MHDHEFSAGNDPAGPSRARRKALGRIGMTFLKALVALEIVAVVALLTGKPSQSDTPETEVRCLSWGPLTVGLGRTGTFSDLPETRYVVAQWRSAP